MPRESTPIVANHGRNDLQHLLAAVPLLLGEEPAGIVHESHFPDTDQPATSYIARTAAKTGVGTKCEVLQTPISLPRVNCGPTKKEPEIEDQPEFMDFLMRRNPRSPYTHGLNLFDHQSAGAGAGADPQHGAHINSTHGRHNKAEMLPPTTSSSWRSMNSSQGEQSPRDSNTASSNSGGKIARESTQTLVPLSTRTNDSLLAYEDGIVRNVHTPPKNWGFANGHLIADGIDSDIPDEKQLVTNTRERVTRALTAKKRLRKKKKRGNKKARASTAGATIGTMSKAEQGLDRLPAITISDELRRAIELARSRPVSVPNDPPGRVNSEYFRPSTGSSSTSISSGFTSWSNTVKTRPSTVSTIASSSSCEENHAIRKMQALVRMKQARDWVWDPSGGLAAERGATHIQRIFRGFIVRFREAIELRNLRIASAIAIQSVYRGHLGRYIAMDKRLKREELSLQIVQCAWRSAIARRKLRKKRHAKCKRNAIIIQSWWRGIFLRVVGKPHPMIVRKLRKAKQRSAIRKHFAFVSEQIEEKKKEKQQKANRLIAERNAAAAAEAAAKAVAAMALSGIPTTGAHRSHRRHRRQGNLREERLKEIRQRKHTTNGERAAEQHAQVNTSSLLNEALVAYAITGIKRYPYSPMERAEYLFYANLPYVRQAFFSSYGRSECLPTELKPQCSMNADAEDALSFLCSFIVFGLSVIGRDDVIGHSLALLHDLSIFTRMVNAPANVPSLAKSIASNKRKGVSGIHVRNSNAQDQAKLPFKVVLRDYFHANMLNQCKLLESETKSSLEENTDELKRGVDPQLRVSVISSIRNFVVASVVGEEILVRDDFECIETLKNLDGRVHRIDRLLKRSRKLALDSMEFRKESKRRAAEASGESVRVNNAQNGKSTPRGGKECIEDREARLVKQTRQLVHGWFSAETKAVGEEQRDPKTGAIARVHLRGSWIIVDGYMQMSKIGHKTVNLDTATFLESYVMSKDEAQLAGISVMDEGGNLTSENTLLYSILSNLRIIRGGFPSNGKYASDSNQSGDGMDVSSSFTPSMRLVVMPVERRRMMRRKAQDMNRAATKIQRCYKGRRLQNALSRRIALHKRSRDAHQQLLTRVVAKHQAHQKHHANLVSKVKAAFIARRQRKLLRKMHSAASKIQGVMRQYLSWLREEERKAWEKYGAQVRLMYNRPRLVSGKAIVVKVQRAGKNWMLEGIDHELGEVYRGLVKEQQVLRLIRRHKYGRDQGYSTKRRARIYAWEHGRVLQLLLSCLAITDAIEGLGELDKYDGKRIMVCDENFKEHVEGPSILDLSGQGRVLNDTKHALPKPAGGPTEDEDKDPPPPKIL